ncbi:hypothetical protein ES703_51477 [subsurface metagenome]
MAIVITEKTHLTVKKVTFDWTLVAGVAAGTTTKTYDGEVLRVCCKDCFSTGYVLLLQDSDKFDLLGGQGATMTSSGKDFGTSTGGSKTYPLSVVSGALTLDVESGYGFDESVGKTIVYIR